MMLIAIFFVLLDVVSSINRCVAPAAATGIYPAANPCLGVVTYPYYVQPNRTAAELHLKAVKALGNKKFGVMSAVCRSAILKHVCASIYLKCNETTASTRIYKEVDSSSSVYLPFQRPCVSLCTNVQTQCSGLFSLFGIPLNCTAKVAYYTNATHPLPLANKYDTSNSAAFCNPLSKKITLAGSSEAYLYANTKGVCAGIIDNVYVPLANTYNAALAPFQSPSIYQILVEAALVKSVTALPSFLEKNCNFALRKFLCTIQYLAPEVKHLDDLLYANQFDPVALGLNVSALPYMNHSMYLPSYPSQKVCTDYRTICHAVVKKNPPQCETLKNGAGIYSFPANDQVVSTLNVIIPAKYYHNISVSTSPHSYATAVDQTGYETVCPPGFVVPDDYSDPDNTLILGCAFPCRWPLYNEAEYEFQSVTARNCAVMGMILVFFLCLMLISDEKKRTRKPLITFGAASILGAIFHLISTVDTIPLEDKFCRSNAVGYNGDDGLTYCAAQSIINEYAMLVMAMAWLWQCFDFFDNAWFNGRLRKYWKYELAIVLVLPMISAIYKMVNKTWAWSPAGIQCGYASSVVKRYDDMNTYHIPIYFALTAGILLMFAAIVKYICFTRNAGEDEASGRRKSRDNNNMVNSGAANLPIGHGEYSRSPHPSLSSQQVYPVSQSHSQLQDQLDPADAVIAQQPLLKKEPIVAERCSTCCSMVFFILVFFIMFAMTTAFRRKEDDGKPDKPSPAVQSFLTWFACVFANFKKNDDSWIAKCGLEAPIRTPRSSLFIGSLYIAVWPVVLGVIFFPEMVGWACTGLYLKYRNPRQVKVYCDAPAGAIAPAGVVGAAGDKFEKGDIEMFAKEEKEDNRSQHSNNTLRLHHNGSNKNGNNNNNSNNNNYDNNDNIYSNSYISYGNSNKNRDKLGVAWGSEDDLPSADPSRRLNTTSNNDSNNNKGDKRQGNEAVQYFESNNNAMHAMNINTSIGTTGTGSSGSHHSHKGAHYDPLTAVIIDKNNVINNGHGGNRHGDIHVSNKDTTATFTQFTSQNDTDDATIL